MEGSQELGYTNSLMEPIAQKGKMQKQLLRWFEKKGRDLPWRRSRDPYAIWVSEIMLQQTQVATVIPYYQKFLKAFPTIRHLAQADLSKVLKAWEGLGYYSRARNLHHASKVVLNHFQGNIPDNLKDISTLPGIGKYTAGAILSIAYNKEAPILDGNVKRVLSRLFAVSSNSVRGKTEDLLWQLSESLIPEGFASSFNQALMDLGAMVCTPKDPQCSFCPLDRLCKGKASGDPERYPSKMVKKKIPHIEAIAAVLHKDGKVLLNQRPPRGLLGGLWEFPNWKSEGNPRLRSRLRDYIKKEMGMNVEVKGSIGTFKQTFTHFKLTLYTYYCHAKGNGKEGKWIAIKKLGQLAMPRIHRRIAETMKLIIARQMPGQSFGPVA